MIVRSFVACVLALLSAAALARFEADVDTKVLSEADTLRLTLRADSANVSGDPDFGSLGESFEILSTQRSSEFRSINGQVDGSTAWTLLLKPKRTGTIVIPPITFGSQKSTAIEVTVRELDPQLKRAIAQTVFFETTYEPKQVYVQGQMVVTRRLFYLNGAQLYGDMPNVPDVPGAMVKSLGESEHTTAIRDGRQYGMIEQRFAVFPERSGDLAIPPASVTGSVRLTDASGGGRRIGIDVASDPLTVQVLPIPDDYPRDAAWLPATDVELLEDWPYDAKAGLATGTPTQRTLIVRVDGNAASAIPPLTIDLPASLKAYPDQPKLSESQTRGGIVGTRTESTSLVATEPGQLTLPEVRLPWWDTAHRQFKVASLPARTIAVTGAAIPRSAPTKSPQQQPAAAAPQPAAPPATNERTVPRRPIAIAVAFGAALIAVVLGALAAARRPRPSRAERRRSANLERHAFDAFKRAADRGDVLPIRRALDAWLKARYGASIDVATREFTRDAAAQAALDGLNGALYRRDAATRFDAGELRRAVAAARRRTHAARRSAEFPALYPSA